MLNDKEPNIILDDHSKVCSEISRKMAFKKPVRKVLFDDGYTGYIATAFIAKHRWRLVRNRKQQEEVFRRTGVDYLALDVGLMCFMMDHCSRSDHRKNRDQNDDGTIDARLIKVGCRLTLTQEQIADMYKVVRADCSRSHVSKQLNLMYDIGIIVDKGYGCYEFDAELCWNGSIEHWKAYRKVQRTKYDTVFIMPNGEEVRFKNFMRELDDYNHDETLESLNEETQWLKVEFRERMKSEV